MDIEKLKSQWNSIEIPPASGADNPREFLSKVTTGRVNTLRDRYLNISRMLIVVCVCGLFISVPYFSATPTLGILMAAYFVFLGVVHAMTFFKVRDLNFSRLTIRQAIERVCIIESDRIRKRTLGIALGVPLVFYLTMTLWDRYGETILYGCIVGIFIGLGIGVVINHRASEILREMRRQLKDCDTQD